MAYPYSTLPSPISDSTTATPNTHAGHHNSVHSALNDILTELATAPRSLVSLHSSLLGVKVWSSTQYVWSGGTAPDTNSYTQILFIDPGGGHDPTTSTGGRTNTNDLWETGGGSSGGGALVNDSVTNAILANVATATVKGRVAGSTGDPTDLTATQLTTLVNTFTSSLSGAAPSSGGGTSNFLRADGTWAAPSGGGGSGTSLLASKVYNPGTVASYSTTSTTFADVDATNLVVTFTAPASGQVAVDLCGVVLAGPSTEISWNLRDSGNISGTTAAVYYAGTVAGMNAQIKAMSRAIVAGLTSGNSYTWKWGSARTSGSGSANTLAGGGQGQATMTVWSA